MKALVSIEQLLNNPKSLKKFGGRQTKETAKIQNHFAEYRVQFCGVIKDGRRYIHCNFFRADADGTYWKNRYILVDDGGFWYWSILYNPETRELSGLEINGEA